MKTKLTIQQIINEIPYTKLLNYFNYEDIILDTSYFKYINYDEKSEAILYYPKGTDTLYLMDEKFNKMSKMDFFISQVKELDKEILTNILLDKISKIENENSTRLIKEEFKDNAIITLFLDIQRLGFYEKEDFDVKMFSLPPFNNKFFYHSQTSNPCLVMFHEGKISNLVYFNDKTFNYQYHHNDAYWTSDYDLHTATTPLMSFNPYNFQKFFQNNNPLEYISIVPHINCNYQLYNKFENFRTTNNIVKDFHILLSDNSKELQGYLNICLLHLQHNQKEELSYFYKIIGDKITFYIKDSVKQPDPLNIINLQSLIMEGLKEKINITNKDVDESIYQEIGYTVENSSDKFIILSFAIKYEYVVNLIDKLYSFEDVRNPFSIIRLNTIKVDPEEPQPQQKQLI